MQIPKAYDIIQRLRLALGLSEDGTFDQDISMPSVDALIRLECAGLDDHVSFLQLLGYDCASCWRVTIAVSMSTRCD